MSDQLHGSVPNTDPANDTEDEGITLDEGDDVLEDEDDELLLDADDDDDEDEDLDYGEGEE